MKSKNAKSNAVSSTGGLSFGDSMAAGGNVNLNIGHGESVDDRTKTNPDVTSNEGVCLGAVSDKKDIFTWKISLFSIS